MTEKDKKKKTEQKSCVKSKSAQSSTVTPGGAVRGQQRGKS